MRVPADHKDDFMEKKSVDTIHLVRNPNLLIIRNTPKGRALFATSSIPSHTILEVSPVLIFPTSDLAFLKQTFADHYTYNWPLDHPSVPGKTITTQALALGLGSIFNHSARNQNVGFRRDVAREVIVYETLRDVEVGEELCVNYGMRLWFEDADGVGGDEDEILENGIRAKDREIEKGEAVLGAIKI